MTFNQIFFEEVPQKSILEIQKKYSIIERLRAYLTIEAKTMNVWVEKRLHVLTQLFYGIEIETNQDKYISQYLAQKMPQYQKHVDN